MSLPFTNQLTHFAKTLSWHLDYPLMQPDKVVILLTHRCPLSCVMCATHDSDLKNELPLASWLKAIDSMGRIGVKEITISGGEIMLRKDDLVAMIQRATLLGIRTSIVTSGFGIKQSVVEEIYNAGLSVWMNSLDGPDAETHNGIRRRAKSFDEVLTTMRLIGAVRKTSRDHIRDKALRDSFHYGTITTVMRQNHDKLAATCALSRQHGADFAGFQAVTNDARNLVNLLTPHDIPALQREVDALKQMKRDGIAVGNSEAYLDLLPVYFQDHRALLKDVQCYAGFNHFTLTAQGHVCTCMGTVVDPAAEGVMNLDIDVERLWRMAPMNAMRARMRRCEDPCFLACWANC